MLLRQAGKVIGLRGPRRRAGRRARCQAAELVQNATFALMIDGAPASGYGTASALWNLAYDAGYGAGPMVFDVLVAYTGYPAAFRPDRAADPHRPAVRGP